MLDYDRLLDDWAELVYEKVDKLEEKMAIVDVGSTRYCYLKGHQDAFLQSLAMLSLLEKRKKSKYIIKKDAEGGEE